MPRANENRRLADPLRPRKYDEFGLKEFAPIRAMLGDFRIVHRSMLRARGVSALTIKRMIAFGHLTPLRRDWLIGENCDDTVIRAVHVGTTLGCISAAKAHGLWEVKSTHLHLSAADNLPRLDASLPATLKCRLPLVVHRTRHPEPNLAPRVRAPVESVGKCLLTIARCQPLEQAVSVVDSALRRGKIGFGDLQQLVRTHPWFAQVADEARYGSDSDAETVARMRLQARGIRVTMQVMIDGHPVDLLIGDRFVLQLDGYGPHITRDQHNRDLTQDDHLRRMGFIVVRYSRDMVMDNWELIESTILSAVRAGDHLFSTARMR